MWLQVRMTAIAAAALLLIGGTSAVTLAAGPMLGSNASAALRAKTSLAEAVSAAEIGTGGHATAADVVRGMSGHDYKITVVANGRVMEKYVALATGKIVKSVDKGELAKAFDAAQRRLFERMMSSPTTMLGAIAAAERKTSATAIAARLIDAKGGPEIRVALARNDKSGTRETAAVDLATGKVTAEAVAQTGSVLDAKSKR